MLLVQTVLWVRQASYRAAHLTCLLVEVSLKSKGGYDIYTSVHTRLSGSRVCIYYREKIQMETTQFGV